MTGVPEIRIRTCNRGAGPRPRRRVRPLLDDRLPPPAAGTSPWSARPGGRGGWAGRWSSWSRCAAATAGRATASTASCSTAWRSTRGGSRGRRSSITPMSSRSRGRGKGLLEALGERACVVVTDDYAGLLPPPHGAPPRRRRLPVRLEAVDSNGLLPLRAADRTSYRRLHFRRFLQKVLPDHLEHAPAEDPLAAPLPRAPGPASAEIPKRWPAASPELLAAADRSRRCPSITRCRRSPARAGRGGGGGAGARPLPRRAAGSAMARGGTIPGEDVTSALSPYLHFGHISPHQVFAALAARERWTPRAAGRAADRRARGVVGDEPGGGEVPRRGVTWREVGYNMAAHREDFERYESLPEWARATLAKHESDPRPHLYSRAELRGGRRPTTSSGTPPRGSSARRGASTTICGCCGGRRCSTGPPSPREALATLIDLNNRYALDGRDPNSYSGIFWCLGRYDRPWPPERPVFGTVRYMSTESTRRKFKVDGYVDALRRGRRGRCHCS